MPETFLTPEVMAIVGTSTPGRRGLITADHIRRFCAAIDDPNPVHLDAQAARAAGHAGIISPPLFNAASTRPVPYRSGLLDDGQYETAAPPGLGHLQTMLAGQRWHLLRPARVGEEVIETFTTNSITERQGKTGTIVFVEKEATIATLDDDLIERYTSTLILRRPPPPLAAFVSTEAVDAAPATAPATVLTANGFIKNPDMISLFMFAASIWAVHRIHWDVPYARSEGLPLPILPGWMLSSYLAQLAEMRAPVGTRLSTIDVRYRSSAYPGDSLACTVASEADTEKLELKMVNQHGVELATASVAFADI